MPAEIVKSGMERVGLLLSAPGLAARLRLELVQDQIKNALPGITVALIEELCAE
jgi:hypothetical protein